MEFKLASNSQLKKNLSNQVAIYQRASVAQKTIKVIVFFTLQQYQRVKRILSDLKLGNEPSIVLIDARSDNKPAAFEGHNPRLSSLSRTAESSLRGHRDALCLLQLSTFSP